MLSNTQFQTVPPGEKCFPIKLKSKSVRTSAWASIHIPKLLWWNCEKQFTRLVLATWEMPSSRQCQEGHLSAPQRPRPGLLQLALLRQDNGQVVHRLERAGMLRSQLGLAAFQGSAVQPFRLAARGGALMCRNMRRAPAQAPWVMEREETPTKATIFGL